MTRRRRALTPELLEDRCTPTTFTVTTPADAGVGTLRQAILDANNEVVNPGSDTITFSGAAAAGAINLTTVSGTQFGPNALEVTSTIVITGTGETIARGGAAPNFRLFFVSTAGNLTLTNVTLSNGLARGGNGGTNLSLNGGGGGGGLGAGGAIYNQGTVSILSSTLSGNAARGGDGGAGADTVGTFAGGGGGGGGMGGNGGTTPDTAPQTDGGAGGGGFFGSGVAGAGSVGGGGGGTTNDAVGAVGGVANGGAGGPNATTGTAGGLGGGGGGGGEEGSGGAGGVGGGGGGGGENDAGAVETGGAGGFGGGGGGGGEDGTGGAGGFGGGGAGASNAGAAAQTGGAGGDFGGNGGSTAATQGSGGGGGGAGLGGAIFNDGGTITITGSTITTNSATGGTGGAAGGTATAGGAGSGAGGGLFNHLGTVTIRNSTITQNTVSTDGGGIENAATMTITGSAVSNNTASNFGGGIRNVGTLTIDTSTIATNTTTGNGGGINNGFLGALDGVLVLTNSTVSGNTAQQFGGGLRNVAVGANAVRVTNSTFVGNTSQAGAGGGINTTSGTVTIVNATITGNADNSASGTRSGGVSAPGGTVTMANSAVAGNTTADTVARDVRGTFAAGSINNFFTFVDANTNLAGGVDGNLVAADAKLGPFQDNGGPTQTRLPLTGSPLLNAGSNTAAVALSSDQRGFLPRVVGGTIDIGSVEVGAAAPAAPAITSTAAAAFAQGVAGTFAVTSTGNPTATLTATGLPTGVTFTDNGDGTATLAHPTTAAPGVYPLTITAANGVGTNATQTFTLTIRAPIPYLLGGPTDGTVRTLSNGGGVMTLGAAFAGIAGLGVNARTAVADVTGDGVPDFIVGAGPGAVSRVAVLNGTDKSVVVQFNVFETTFTGGVFVAAADIDGDGRAEVVVTPDESGGPVVAVYRGSKLAAGVGGEAAQLTRYFGIAGDPNFRGGCRPALGDLNGDGAADLVVSAGVQGGPRIAIFDGQALKAGSGDPGRLVGDFFAFENTLRNGAFVAAGDVTGDGRADVAFGGGPGGAPRVRLFDGKALLAAPSFSNVDDIAGAAQKANFFAGDPNLRGGVRLALHDVDGSGAAALAAGSGAGEQSHVRFYRAATLLAGAAAADQDFDPFGAVLANGVFVG